MRVNVTKLKITKKYRGALHEKDWDRVTLEIQIANDGMVYVDGDTYTWWPMLHSQEMIDRLIAQLHGKVRWDKKVSFDDGNYQLRTGREMIAEYQIRTGYDGFEIWKRNGTRMDIELFCFPGAILADRIKSLYVSKEYPESEYEYSPEELEAIKRRWWPKARLEFTSQEARNRFMKCFVGREWDEETGTYGPPGNFPDDWTEKNVQELREDTRCLMRIARNHSDGEPCIVHMSTDFVDHSFYWWAADKNGNRIMNGGIIAHRYEDEETGDTYYKYSTHT